MLICWSLFGGRRKVPSISSKVLLNTNLQVWRRSERQELMRDGIGTITAN